MSDKTNELIDDALRVLPLNPDKHIARRQMENIITLCANHYRDKAHARFMKCKGEVRRVGLQIVEDVFKDE